MPRPVLEAMTGHLAARSRDRRLRGRRRSRSAPRRRLRQRRPADRGAARRDRADRERHRRLADGVLRARRRHAPGDRILTARAEYAANYVAFLQVARRAGVVIEVIPDDARRRARSRGVAAHARRARAADRDHLDPDQWRPGEPRRRGRPDRARSRHALPARRLPGRRPDAGRRRCAGLRHALGHRPQVPARPARHRLSLYPPRTAATGSSHR